MLHIAAGLPGTSSPPPLCIYINFDSSRVGYFHSQPRIVQVTALMRTTGIVGHMLRGITPRFVSWSAAEISYSGVIFHSRSPPLSLGFQALYYPLPLFSFSSSFFCRRCLFPNFIHRCCGPGLETKHVPGLVVSCHCYATDSFSSSSSTSAF